METKNLNDIFNLSINLSAKSGLKTYLAAIYCYGLYLIGTLLLIAFWGFIGAKFLEIMQAIF